MLLSILLTTIAFGLCGAFHYIILSRALVLLGHLDWSAGVKLVVGLYVSGIVHIVEAGIYAATMAAALGFGIGGFKNVETMDAMELFYFSLVNYTSLGLADIYPSGHMRFIAGVEALNGFLLISASASFIFLIIRNRKEV